MSSASVRKNLAAKMKNALSTESNELQREALQNKRPQVLYLDDLEFINNTIRKITRGLSTMGTKKDYLRKDLTVTFTSKDLKKAKDIVRPFQDKFIKANKIYKEGGALLENTMAGQYLKVNQRKVYNKILAEEAFMVQSFSVLGTIKNLLVDEFVDGTKEQLAKIKLRINRGHGVGEGFAVSGTQIAEAQAAAYETLNDDEIEEYIKALEDFLYNAYNEEQMDLKTYDDIISVVVNYEQIVDPKTGKLKNEYIPIVTYQDQYENKGIDSAREKKALKMMREFTTKLGAGAFANMEGSSSLNEKMAATVIAQLLNNIKQEKTIRLAPNIDPRKVKFTSKGSAEAKGGSRKNRGSIKTRKRKVSTVAIAPKKTKAKTSKVNLTNLLGVLNNQLPRVVARNMGGPRLENRTGRFAQSVRATDVAQTPQGFPSIGYTYMKERYGGYESTSGSRFADVDRDPRPLIDQSIREIAASFALGRIYTRRQ